MMILLLAALVLCCDGAINTWSHEAILDGDSAVHFAWFIKNRHVTFELTVAALGYVAVGFSPNGGMKGSDIMMAWVADDGKVHFYDMFAIGNMAPKLDESQDIHLISGTQNSSHTVIRFRRKLVTCDGEYDRDLGDDTIRVIWAYSNEDPKSLDDLQWHRETRGTKSLFLMSTQGYSPNNHKLDGFKHWEVLANQVELPHEKQTFYWCSLLKVPTLSTKHHIVASFPVIPKENAAFVHHMVLYECYHPDGNVFEQYLENNGHECHSANMPPDLKRCITAVTGWAVGSEGDIFTEKAGFPLKSTEDNPLFFLLEIHYDNPMLKKGVVDSSGLRLYYTDQLRQHDAGTFIAGHHVQPTHIIPPKQSSYTNAGACVSECTSKGLPEEGIKVFQVFPHAHIAGKAVRVRHFRNKKELPPIIEDNHYDFNYQQARTLVPEVTILPGDEIIVECDYTTESRQNITYGGLGTSEEMCLAYMSVYPAPSMILCGSTPSYKTFEQYAGAQIKNASNVFLNILGNTEALNTVEGRTKSFESIVFDSPVDMDFNQYLSRINWTPETAESLQQATMDGPLSMLCINNTMGMVVYPTEEIKNPAALYGLKKQNKKASQCNMKGIYGHKKSNLYTKLRNKLQ